MIKLKRTGKMSVWGVITQVHSVRKHRKRQDVSVFLHRNIPDLCFDGWGAVCVYIKAAESIMY